jgi:hypothetical protein
MDDYESALRARIEERLDEFRVALQNPEASAEPVAHAAARARARVGESVTDDAPHQTSLSNSFGSVVSVYESNDGKGQDVEIRLTMPIGAFMEFAPIAALEAASIPHKFPSSTSTCAKRRPTGWPGLRFGTRNQLPGAISPEIRARWTR